MTDMYSNFLGSKLKNQIFDVVVCWAEPCQSDHNKFWNQYIKDMKVPITEDVILHIIIEDLAFEYSKIRLTNNSQSSMKQK